MEVMVGVVRSEEEALEEVSEVSAAEWAGDSVAAAQAGDGRNKQKLNYLKGLKI